MKSNSIRPITEKELYSSTILAVARKDLHWYDQLHGVPVKPKVFKNEPSRLLKKYGKVLI